MKETLKLTLSLGLICAAAALILAFAHRATQPAQEAAILKEQQASLKLVLPEFDNNPVEETLTVSTKAGRDVTFYPARQNGSLTALGAKSSSEKGYGGNLEVLAGLNLDGTIRAVVVTQHAETPGLGTQVTDRKRSVHIRELFTKQTEEQKEEGLPPSKYLDQYSSKTIKTRDRFALKADGGEIQAVSGATVSSRAVADAVTAIAAAFQQNQATLRQLAE